MAESSVSLQRDIRISHSVIPEHFNDADEDDGDGDGLEPEEDAEGRGGREGGRPLAGFMGS
jgi:hypothetical protein